MTGCGSLPVMRPADNPSFVVAMISDPPGRRIGTTALELPVGDGQPELLVDRRPEPLPPEPESEPDFIENTELPETESMPSDLDRQLDFEPIVDSEVVGLRLNGLRSWQRLNILDMEVVLDDDSERYLPLLRILSILDIEHSSDFVETTFHLQGEPEIRIDLATATAWMGDSQHPIRLLTGISDITGRPEIYVSAAELQRLLPIHLAWDDINYEFKGTTNRSFSVWERRSNQQSLLFADANLVGMELPSLLGTAEPSQHKLSFMEWRWNSRLSTGESRDSQLTVGTAPTVWGNVLGGRYKVSLTDAEMNVGSEPASQSNSLVPRHVDWTYSNPNSELVVGDSSFGLHDLAFPVASYSGIRFNGLIGSSATEAANDVSSRGLHRRFYRPHVFEGYAPVGSEVRLEMNGNVIEVQRVLEETDPILGTGVFRFENIALATNSLSNIRAVITDADGVETEIERELIGAPQLLPAGRLSYVGGLGTARTHREWETSGSLAAGRVLYGVNDRISIGTSMAMQSGFFDLTNVTDGNDRLYPDSSRHAVAEFMALPLSNVTLSGDVALSGGSDTVDQFSFDGTAYRLRSQYFPTRNMQFGSQWFQYNPGYFDGRNRELENKTGYTFDAQLRPLKNWSVRGAIGTVNQIEGQRYLGRRTADYSQLQVTTSTLPRTNLILTLDKNDLSWEKPKTLTSIRSRTRFLNGLDLRLDASFGDQLSPAGDQDYFQGLNLPGFRRFGADNRFLALDKQLNSIHRVGVEYRDTGLAEKLYAVHAFETSRLRMSSKLGYDLQSDKPVWEGWWDYPFQERGRDRLSLISRYERGEWRVDLAMNLVSLFEYDNGGIGRVPGDRFNPDRGGVKGRVFVDVNGNGLLDKGEHGIPDIEVHGEGHVRASTNDDGRFYLPVSVTSNQMQVALNVDTIPATYSVVHGKQNAAIGPGGATEVNLAVTPLVAISGSILLKIEEPDEVAIAKYRQLLAVELNVDPDTEPVAEFDTDNIVVLSHATRIGPQSDDELQDVSRDAGQAVAEATTDFDTNLAGLGTGRGAIAESPGESTLEIVDTHALEETVVAEATAESAAEPVFEDRIADGLPQVEISPETPIAVFAAEPEPVSGLYEPAKRSTEVLQQAYQSTGPRIAGFVPDWSIEREAEMRLAEIAAEWLPAPLEETAVAAATPEAPEAPEPEIAETIPLEDRSVAEATSESLEAPEPDIVEIIAPEETLVAAVTLESLEAPDPEIADTIAPTETAVTAATPALTAEPGYEGQIADMLPQVEIPADVQIAVLVGEPEPIPGLFEPAKRAAEVLQQPYPSAGPQIVGFVPEWSVERETEIRFAKIAAEALAADTPGPADIETIPLEETVLAEATQEPVAEKPELEIVETIPLEETVLAEALPEPVAEEPALTIAEAIPLEEAVLASASPEPDAEEPALEIDEANPPEESVLADALPEAEVAGAIPLEEPVLAKATPEPVAEEPELEIVETIPVEEAVVAETLPELADEEPDLETADTIALEETGLAEATPAPAAEPGHDDQAADALAQVEIPADMQVAEFAAQPIPGLFEPAKTAAEVLQQPYLAAGPQIAGFDARPVPVPELSDTPEAEIRVAATAAESVTATDTPSLADRAEPEPVVDLSIDSPVYFEVLPEVRFQTIVEFVPEPAPDSFQDPAPAAQLANQPSESEYPSIGDGVEPEAITADESVSAPGSVSVAANESTADSDLEFSVWRRIDADELENWETELEVPITVATAQTEPMVEQPEQGMIETISPEETVVAEALPEPVAEQSEPELSETLPPEDAVVAEATPEPVEEPEPEVIETIPLKETVVAEATPVAEEPELAIAEITPFEDFVFAERTPEPSAEAEPAIIETIPLEETVVAKATPEPVEEPGPNIIETLPLEEIVLAEATPEPEIIETIPLEEPVIAKANPEPVVEESEPEIVETLPLEEIVLAEATPEPVVEQPEPDIIETLPLEDIVLAESVPKPVVEKPELEIAEIIPFEDFVFAERTPEPAAEPEPDIIETLPLEEIVLAETTAEPVEATDLEIVQTIPLEEPVLTEARPEVDSVDQDLRPRPKETSDPIQLAARESAAEDELEEIVLAEVQPQAEALLTDNEINATEPAGAAESGRRNAHAVEMHRPTLLTMSTALTHEIDATPDHIQRANPPLRLAMARHIDHPPSLNAEPDTMLAASDSVQEQPDRKEPGSSTGLQLSRKLEKSSDEIVAEPKSPADPVALQMARTLETQPLAKPAVVTPHERAVAATQSDEARASGMKLARALNLKRHTLKTQSVSGIRVVMRDTNNQVVADSVTASDGSFYLSNLRPGSYTLEVDPKSIPDGYIILEMSKTIEIFQGEDFQEIEIPPIYAVADLDRAALR